MDLVFLDINMPDMNGIDTCKLLRSKYPHLPIVVLTHHDNKALILHLYQLGVQSFLTKNVEVEELETALAHVRKGERYFPKQIELLLKKALIEHKTIPQRIQLTPQEKQLFKFLLEGKTSKEIARQMKVTAKTIDTYRERLLEKTNTANVAQLISFGYKAGILN